MLRLPAPFIALVVFVTAGAFVAPGPAGVAVTAPENAFREMLGAVADDVLSPVGSLITYVDMDLIWERVGIGSDRAERAAYESMGSLPMAAWPDLLVDGGFERAEELSREIGFDGFDIQRVLVAGVPPHQVMVVDTSVDDEVVIDALRADPAWSSDLQEVEFESALYYQWTDDPVSIHLDRRSVLRPFGQGGTLAIVGDDPTRVVRTNDPADIEATLLAASGTDASVAEDPHLRAALDSLGNVDVTQAVVQPRPTLFDPAAVLFPSDPIASDPESVLAAAQNEALPVDPYLGLVVVEVVDGDTVRAEILVIHPDGASAEANVDPIVEHITTGTLFSGDPASEEFEGAEVEADGSIVRIIVPGDVAFRRMYQLLTSRSLLPI